MRKPGDDVLLKALAAEVKARRQFLGLSQEELAFRSDVNRTFIGKIEVGSSQPSMAVLFHLAHALEVLPAEFIAAVDQRAQTERRGRSAKSRTGR
jgi:transcriptional regulator with XRE-family HTH domain